MADVDPPAIPVAGGMAGRYPCSPPPIQCIAESCANRHVARNKVNVTRRSIGWLYKTVKCDARKSKSRRLN